MDEKQHVLVVVADYSAIDRNTTEGGLLRNVISKYIESSLPVKVDTAKTEDEAIQKIESIANLAAVVINLREFLNEEIYRMILAAKNKRPHPLTIAATFRQLKIPEDMFDRIWDKGSYKDLMNFIQEKISKLE